MCCMAHFKDIPTRSQIGTKAMIIEDLSLKSGSTYMWNEPSRDSGETEYSPLLRTTWTLEEVGAANEIFLLDS